MNRLNPTRTAPRTVTTMLCLSLLLAVTVLVRLCASERFGFSARPLAAVGQLFASAEANEKPSHGEMILNIRLFRVVLAVLVGSSLAASGVALQALLRNPLAEPFILGLSSGAAVGVMTQMLVGHTFGLLFGAAHTGALAGAALSMLIVYVAGQRRGVIDPLGLLLVGVVLSTINGAMIVMISHVLGSVGMRDDLARWMMGYLNENLLGTATVPTLALIAAGGIAGLLGLSRAMDAASFSDGEALSLGVNLRRLRVALFVIACALAAGAVVLAGPIAFVGLVCPHAARLLLGPAHRLLVMGSVLTGAALILAADTATVWLDFGQGRLPLGVLTAVLGGPIFISMLRPQLGRGMA